MIAISRKHTQGRTNPLVQLGKTRCGLILRPIRGLFRMQNAGFPESSAPPNAIKSLFVTFLSSVIHPAAELFQSCSRISVDQHTNICENSFTNWKGDCELLNVRACVNSAVTDSKTTPCCFSCCLCRALNLNRASDVTHFVGMHN